MDMIQRAIEVRKKAKRLREITRDPGKCFMITLIIDDTEFYLIRIDEFEHDPKLWDRRMSKLERQLENIEAGRPWWSKEAE